MIKILNNTIVIISFNIIEFLMIKILNNRIIINNFNFNEF